MSRCVYDTSAVPCQKLAAVGGVSVCDLDHLPLLGFGASHVGADVPFDGARVFLPLLGSIEPSHEVLGEGFYRGVKYPARSYITGASTELGLCL